ncbi:hypothetical protein Lepto7375DRAFT_1402 [Leptolyngbya sp. PCC 7375]|nr:hypothetical protein Lepto7375DRAFT_1402 [Leptolyngbya sp. PCC 7375]
MHVLGKENWMFLSDFECLGTLFSIKINISIRFQLMSKNCLDTGFTQVDHATHLLQSHPRLDYPHI